MQIDQARNAGVFPEIDDLGAGGHRAVASSDSGDAIARHHDDRVRDYFRSVPEFAEPNGTRLRLHGKRECQCDEERNQPRHSLELPLRLDDGGAGAQSVCDSHWARTWEARVYALTRAMRAWRKWNLDADRHQLELLPPADYLRMSYYERWLKRLELNVVKFGFVTANELEQGAAAAGSSKATPVLTIATSASWLNRGIPSSRDPKVRPLFKVGQRVRARNIHPAGHTRLPRYARGKAGVVTRDHGVHAFPDSNAHSQGEKRQHVYSVLFAARELWGEQASARDSVHLDLFDDYLERV